MGIGQLLYGAIKLNITLDERKSLTSSLRRIVVPVLKIYKTWQYCYVYSILFFFQTCQSFVRLLDLNPFSYCFQCLEGVYNNILQGQINFKPFTIHILWSRKLRILSIWLQNSISKTSKQQKRQKRWFYHAIAQIKIARVRFAPIYLVP